MNRLTYRGRLFIGLMLYSAILVGCFAVFQYIREKEFKISELNGKLQIINDMLLDDLTRDGEMHVPLRIAAAAHFPDLRISVIDIKGNILYDTALDSLPDVNHLRREEIAQAVRTGEGFKLRRHSELSDATYFYSARRSGEYIVRTAVPYSISLTGMLAADRTFLWVMAAISLVMCAIGSYMTHRLALHDEQEKLRIRRRLTNNINHELKTPVASMQVCLETLMSHKDMPADKREEFISRCYAANERLRRLLADVSAITRLEDGGAQIAREPVRVAEVVAEVCGECAVMAAKANMTVDNEITSGILPAGNAHMLASVFRNLIENALAYSGGTRIELKQHAEGGKLVYTVADNGVGVDGRHLPRLFERFYRVDKGRSRKSGGTGLGLAIVKNAVLWHGGSVTVENRRDGGLLFTITF